MFRRSRWEKSFIIQDYPSSYLIKRDLDNPNNFVGYYRRSDKINIEYDNYWIGIISDSDNQWIMDLFDQLYIDEVKFVVDKEDKQAKKFLEKFLKQAEQYRAFL